MDILINKQYNSSNHLSRYSHSPYYYNKRDNKYVYGINSQLKKSTQYIIHTVNQGDTLDYLALKYYNDPTFYWVIAEENDIYDCLIDIDKEYKELRIPSITSIEFKDF